MRAVFAILCVAAAAQAASLYQDEWQAFKSQYNKIYDTEEEDAFRFEVFIENSKLVEKHNELYEQGLSTYAMAMNKFGDMLSHEVAAVYNGYKGKGEKTSSSVHQVSNSDLPDTVDWRTKGVVTPVKDQGQCGSCYAFSVTGSLEGQHSLKTGKLVSLSEQNLMDCTYQYGNLGCYGGFIDASFSYIKDNNGIDTESSYPYKAITERCRFKEDSVGATETGFVDIESGNEMALQEAVATVGPVSVAIDASKLSFQFYTTGVYDEPDCSSTHLDHGVLTVGYGNEDGKDYWLVKNSWGREWGDHGYIKMSRNEHNQCGIATEASYPTV